ncbi:LOW QUALITY PROTEIN: dynein intermediate chain 3, ciliary [Drosophila ficusphila]|uniref:LOW QUALITY PROTEIN: dynein intermediate chain 3, ciliary n=1 Tax=Drosophila ficusphila TaxID=30025 RepID=UPI0007E6B23A|nr:LOW QUALITY PROTEIN: dynein intermediate chain 3, ciliary [Drosophila ficusphila]
MGTLGNTFILSRERRRFGRQCLFTDRNEMILSVQPSGRLRLKYILRNPINEKTQLSEQYAASSVLTHNVTLDSHGLNHYEGGWNIKEVNVADEESTMRYRKKVERDDSWGIEVNELMHNVMQISSANNAINIYEDFFTDLPEDLGRGIYMKIAARGINIFHDLWIPPRQLKTCEWLNNEPSQFLLTFSNSRSLLPNYTEPQYILPDFGTENSNSFYIWDLDDATRPVAYYDTRRVLLIAKVCMRDENYMVGGYEEGQVSFWQTSNMGGPLSVCPLEAAHREATTALCWVHSKLNTEFYSGSLDGSVKYWDTRDLLMPVHEVLAEPDPKTVQNRQDAHGVTVLEFEYTIPVRYIIGSDMGYVFVGNRKGTTPQESLVNAYKLFQGPIRAVMRNPFFVKNFLLVGDWRIRIWSEEVKNCPSTFYFSRKNQVISGAWSTGRCSLFCVGDVEGNLEFWDLLMSHKQPILTVKFKHAVTHLVFKPDGSILTVSLANGDCAMLRLEEGMRSATVKEKSLMMSMFEREITRCKLLEARVEEIKLKKRLTTIHLEEERKSREKIEAKKKKAQVKKEQEPKVEDEATIFLRLIESDTEFSKALLDFNEAVEAIATKRAKRVFAMERTVFETAS